MGRTIKTTIEQAVDYWSRHQSECDLSVDWAEARERYWRCGCERNLERCHIVPDALDGPDTPENIVLLCRRCHAEGPNVKDPEVMWDWLKAYAVPFYDTFWMSRGMQEFEFLYGYPFEVGLMQLTKLSQRSSEEVERLIQEKLKETNEEASIHFGQPYFNTATVAGRYRMMLKKMAKELDVDIAEIDKLKKPRSPWWMMKGLKGLADE